MRFFGTTGRPTALPRPWRSRNHPWSDAKAAPEAEQRSRPSSRESCTGIFKPAGNQCQIGDQASLASRRPTRVLYRGFEAPRSD